MKKWLCVLCLSGLLMLGACNQASLPPLPAIFPKIDRKPAPVHWVRGTMDSLPIYDPASEQLWQMDLRSYDLSTLDLRTSLNDLTYADFDSKTIWPPTEMMPQNFNWQQEMELGKNPGLGIRQLHAKNITGYGVGIAIIDQALLVDHQEYSAQLRLYEEASDIQGKAMMSQMHGPAVASIAVGKTTGVAPGADLYYIATSMCNTTGTFEDNDFSCLAQNVRRILKINESLPNGRKIRVISISVGWKPESKGYDEISAATKEAVDAGMLVVCSSIEQVHGFKFHALGRDPLADPDRFESYEPGLWWAKEFYAGEQFSDRLLVPMDSRTTASPTGTSDYVFYREGGWSWSIPYIAGVYALAAQVKPAITPNEFWQLALQTGQTIELNHAGKVIRFGPIIDPAALMIALQK